MTVRPVKTQISLGIRPVWSEFSLSAWKNLGSLATYWVHSKDSHQTGQMPRLIWVLAGHTVILLVLSRGGSYIYPNTSTRLPGEHRDPGWRFLHSTIWATSWENLFMPFANNKDAGQPAHPRSLTSTFVFHCLDSVLPILAESRISRL